MDDTYSLRLPSDDEDARQVGLDQLKAAVEAAPNVAKAWFDHASGLDFLDREQEALAAYEEVFKLGVAVLPPEDQSRLYVQMGSILRLLGEFDRAVSVLEEGRRRYPEDGAILAFYALTEASRNRYHRAVKLLFDALLIGESGRRSIGHYSRALRAYADELDSDDSER